ncbi:helix-turn-helix domain-containing protein [Algibacter sp. 2305UL17-15]|uniref:TetR/AcrR family transcriptional regulator n=1 Tax=Algibacter sp. 2305UL17-15 TaxID=3231268 RepID=UPI00345AF31C
MARDGKPTKDKILAASKNLVLSNGFAGTSIDQILEKTGITKGSFFYHFKTKNALAKALIEEFARDDMSHLEWALQETEHLKAEPLKRLLQFVQLFIDMMTGLKTPHSGCLYASYTNESTQFDPEIKKCISDTILVWRSTMELLLQNVLETHKMVIDEDIKSLADAFTVVFEGGFVLSKALNEPELTANQLRHLKNYFQLLFSEKN